jgi:hypothetical protein
MSESIDIGRILCKNEMIEILKDIKKTANGFVKLWKSQEGKESHVFRTSVKDFPFKKKLHLGAYSKNIRDFAYISLGINEKHLSEGVFYSFNGTYFNPEEKNVPVSPKEVYNFLEDFVASSNGTRSEINGLVFKMKETFQSGIMKAMKQVYSEGKTYRNLNE